MMDVATIVAQFAGVGDTVAPFTSIAKWVLDTVYPPENVIDLIKDKFQVVNSRLQEIQNSIAQLGKVVIDSQQFVNYKKSRDSLKQLSGAYNTWVKRSTVRSAFDTFVAGCEHKDRPMAWFYKTGGAMNEMIKDDNLARSMMEVTERHRGSFTQIARLVKSDMCEAMLLLSACDTARNKSDDHRDARIEEASVIVKKVYERFIEVDKFLVTEAPAEMRKDVKAAMDKASGSSTGGIVEFVYQSIKNKYFWLKMNVNAYLISGSGVHVDELWSPDYHQCTVLTDARAVGRDYRVMIVAWKKNHDYDTASFVRKNTSMIVTPNVFVEAECWGDWGVAATAVKEMRARIDKKEVGYGATGYRWKGKYDCTDINFSYTASGDTEPLFPFPMHFHKENKFISTISDLCTEGGLWPTCWEREIVTMAAIKCSRYGPLTNAFRYP